MTRMAPSSQPPRRLIMIVTLSLIAVVQFTPPRAAATASFLDASCLVGHPPMTRRRTPVAARPPRAIPPRRRLFDPVCGMMGRHNHPPFTPRPLPAAERSDAEGGEDGAAAAREEEEAAGEVLLRVRLSTTPPEGAGDGDDALGGLRDYVRSFPFAAVLPVQPLQYLPTDDGVDVTFLRKKTKEKGSKDGGIVISVFEGDHPAEEDVVDDGEDAVAAAAEAARDGPSGSLDLVARRNPEGQTVSKIFSEKLVVMRLLEGLEEVQSDKGVRIESVFHKWM